MRDQDTKSKAVVTTLIWFTYLGFVLIGITMLEVWGILLAFVLMIPVVMIGMMMWAPTAFTGDESSANSDVASGDKDVEKRKRDRLSQALSQLSDSQLNALRDGIREGDIDDERLRYMIDDEGELVERYS